MRKKLWTGAGLETLTLAKSRLGDKCRLCWPTQFHGHTDGQYVGQCSTEILEPDRITHDCIRTETRATRIVVYLSAGLDECGVCDAGRRVVRRRHQSRPPPAAATRSQGEFGFRTFGLVFVLPSCRHWPMRVYTLLPVRNDHTVAAARHLSDAHPATNLRG
jgi:hypothetical protein